MKNASQSHAFIVASTKWIESSSFLFVCYSFFIYSLCFLTQNLSINILFYCFCFLFHLLTRK